MKSFFAAFALLILAAFTVCAQETKQTNNFTSDVFDSNMYYQESSKELKSILANHTNVKQNIPTIKVNPSKKASMHTSSDNTIANNDSEIEIETINNIAYFPEGFTMQIPDDTYVVKRDHGKYVFQYKGYPNEYADFEVYVTDFDIQQSLCEHDHFCVSKNKNLGLYAILSLDKKSKEKDILGFRLFYTLPIDNHKYVTVRSKMFDNFNQNELYVDNIVSINYSQAYAAR